jgi:hypothetical protein
MQPSLDTYNLPRLPVAPFLLSFLVHSNRPLLLKHPIIVMSPHSHWQIAFRLHINRVVFKWSFVYLCDSFKYTNLPPPLHPTALVCLAQRILTFKYGNQLPKTLTLAFWAKSCCLTGPSVTSLLKEEMVCLKTFIYSFSQKKWSLSGWRFSTIVRNIL